MDSLDFNQVLHTALVIGVPAILIPLMIRKLANSKEYLKRKPGDPIRPVRGVLWIGMICAMFFIGIIAWMLVFPNGTEEWWVYFGFSLFIVSGAGLILWRINYKIVLKEDHLIWRTVFRRTHIIPYSSILEYERRERDGAYTIYTDKRSFGFEPAFLDGSHELKSFLAHSKIKERKRKKKVK